MRNFEDNLMIFHYHKKNLDQFGLMLTVFNSFSWYPTIELWILRPNLYYCIIIIQNIKRNLIFSAFFDTQQNGCRFSDNPQFNCGFYDQIYIIVSLLQNKKRTLIFSAFCDTQQNGCRFRDNPQFNCGFYDQIYIIVSLLQNKKGILYFT